MLSSIMMKSRKNYSLVTSGLFLLAFAAQFLFIAPYEKVGFLAAKIGRAHV